MTATDDDLRRILTHRSEYEKHEDDILVASRLYREIKRAEMTDRFQLPDCQRGAGLVLVQAQNSLRQPIRFRLELSGYGFEAHRDFTPSELLDLRDWINTALSQQSVAA
ncbi:hypothetical protein QBK99_11215 [Corticibacterium sp. UT-5YL-CI-8]|nr:hypothetical protein [Tianweitania sp. UT-5YL-CI-8]